MQLEKYDVIPIVVDLPQRLRTVLRIYYSECRSKGIDLELKLGESMSKLGTAALAKFDPVRLSQILVNLVRFFCVPLYIKCLISLADIVLCCLGSAVQCYPLRRSVASS